MTTDGAMVHADEIRWHADPIVQGEHVDLVVLTDAELFERAEDMQIELRALRALVSVALTQIVALKINPASVQRRDRQVVEELRPRLVAAWTRISEVQ